MVTVYLAAVLWSCVCGGVSVYAFGRIRRANLRIRAMAALPPILPLLEEIQAAFASVTVADIDRAARSMQPSAEGESKLGAVHSIEARKIYALRFKYRLQAEEAELAMRSKASNQEEADLWNEQRARLAQIADCLDEWFWCQVRDDIGGKAWSATSVGIRSGWMLVSTPPKTVPSFLSSMFGGPQQ